GPPGRDRPLLRCGAAARHALPQPREPLRLRRRLRPPSAARAGHRERNAEAAGRRRGGRERFDRIERGIARRTGRARGGPRDAGRSRIALGEAFRAGGGRPSLAHRGVRVGAAALVRARVGARQDAHRLLLNRLASPIFDPLRPALARLPPDRWPTHAELTALAAGVTTSRGSPVRFIAPREHTDRERRYYELHIAETGEVETRPDNWHDLINAQHAAILEEGGEAEAKHRSPARDALTVFDEGGVIVATGDPALTQLIVDFEWKELFWRRRAELEARVRFL